MPLTGRPRAARSPWLWISSLLLLALAVFAGRRVTAPSPTLSTPTESPSAGDIRFTETKRPKAIDREKYLIGVGKADITGPVVDLALAGYANGDQIGGGIRQRLYSRAFIVGDVKRPQDKFVYVVLDNLVGDTAVRYGVLEALAEFGGDYSVYGQHNVVLAAVHSHTAPGNWGNYIIPQLFGGFDKQSYKAVVDGAALSIKRAHESLTEGYLDTGTTEITDTNINRSLWAYLHNPAEERARYGGSTDTTMTLLRFTRAADNKLTGVLTWFPVHGTALYRNHTLVAGDNKGLASWITEEALKGRADVADGFVAGFSQSNLGDASPNTDGPWCEDSSGKQCHFEDATCADGTVNACQGRGPMHHMQDQGVSSCYEIARRQADGVKRILDLSEEKLTPIVGPTVKSFHFFHDMSFWEFALPNGQTATTCPAALGYSFAAGTTDGKGKFDFRQGESGKAGRRYWGFAFGMIKNPSKRQIDCQKPKPILLSAGEASFPYAWEPNLVDVQVLRVGQLFIIASPSEVTTMSGRRWREAVAKAADYIEEDPIVVLGSPANTYAHYVATPEEYDVQRYEGASTLYGRHTLDAYINLTTSNLPFLHPQAADVRPMGPLAPDNRNVSFCLVRGVVYDSHPSGKPYGAVLQQPNKEHHLGDIVRAKFQGANPRNNFRQEGTFAAVERKVGGEWVQVRDDADWFLLFSWKRGSSIRGTSTVEIAWETDSGRDEPGTYRLRYYGDAKSWRGVVSPFEGVSEAFTII